MQKSDFASITIIKLYYLQLNIALLYCVYAPLFIKFEAKYYYGTTHYRNIHAVGDGR